MVEQATATRRSAVSPAASSTTTSHTRRDRLTEVALAAAWLSVLAALLYMPHFQHGGFSSDDWAELAGRYYPPGGPGVGHVISFFAGFFPYRPLLILYMPLKLYAFGDHTSLELIWAVALSVIVATLLYAILRNFGLPWHHAWVVAALTLAYPWSDSARLWVVASASTLAISLAFGGILVALRGLERRSWRLHVLALLLYAASILAYELSLPLIAAAGVLYVLRAGWTREVRIRWAADLVVVVVTGWWDGAHTTRTISSLSGDLTHLKQIVVAGGTMLGRSLYPLGPHGYTTTALVLIAAVFTAGTLALLWGRRSGEETSHRHEEGVWGLRHWLALGAAGILLAALGWVMLIPADPYYTPAIYGITNRINALSGLGLVLALYAAGGVVVSLVGRFVPLDRRLLATSIVGLGICLGAAYVHVLERHIDLWDQAYAVEKRGMERIKATFPGLPPGSTVIAADYPANETLGVPILNSGMDLNGMIKLAYDDGSLSAFPRVEGMDFACRPHGIAVSGYLTTPTEAQYPSVRIIDLPSGSHTRVRNRRGCEAALGEYPSGPAYLTTGY